MYLHQKQNNLTSAWRKSMEITKSSTFNKIAGLAGEKRWRECGIQDKEVNFTWILKGNSMGFLILSGF